MLKFKLNESLGSLPFCGEMEDSNRFSPKRPQEIMDIEHTEEIIERKVRNIIRSFYDSIG